MQFKVLSCFWRLRPIQLGTAATGLHSSAPKPERFLLCLAQPPSLTFLKHWCSRSIVRNSESFSKNTSNSCHLVEGSVLGTTLRCAFQVSMHLVCVQLLLATHTFATAPKAPQGCAWSSRAHANPLHDPELLPDIHTQSILTNQCLSQEPGLDAWIKHGRSVFQSWFHRRLPGWPSAGHLSSL